MTNAAFTLVNPLRTGYTFVGWTGTGLDAPTNDVTIAAGSTGACSYVAHWTTNAYTVCFHINDGSGATRSQDFLYDEPQSLDLVGARTGYDFSRWTTIVCPSSSVMCFAMMCLPFDSPSRPGLARRDTPAARVPKADGGGISYRLRQGAEKTLVSLVWAKTETYGIMPCVR